MTVDFKQISKRLGYDDIREYVVLTYYLNEHTANECADECGVNHQTFKSMMEAENFPRREKGNIPPREWVCKECKRKFKTKKGGKRPGKQLKPEELPIDERKKEFILYDNY